MASGRRLHTDHLASPLERSSSEFRNSLKHFETLWFQKTLWEFRRQIWFAANLPTYWRARRTICWICRFVWFQFHQVASRFIRLLSKDIRAALEVLPKCVLYKCRREELSNSTNLITHTHFSNELSTLSAFPPFETVRRLGIKFISAVRHSPAAVAEREREAFKEF